MPEQKSHRKDLERSSGEPAATIFFYLPNEIPYGAFCQWYPSRINLPTASLDFLVDQSPLRSSSSAILENHHPSITFTCAEQLYMFSKALYFADAGSCARILATSDPKQQKKLGRGIKHHNEYKWTRVKQRVAMVGNWYKFKDKGGLRDVLLESGNRELCEASPTDRVWGIGFDAESAEKHRGDWGESLLGKAIMMVRARMRGLLETEREGGMVEWEWNGAKDDGAEEPHVSGGQTDGVVEQRAVGGDDVA